MGEQKYFTPEIEDIRVGYECEMRQADIWEFYRVPYNDCLSDYADMDGIRTPYLTKEQIEAEGWTPLTEGNEYQWYRDDKSLALKLYPGLGTKGNKRVIRIWQEMKHGNQLFVGECKSINEFRKLCKMLNIN